MNLNFSPAHASILGERAVRLAGSAAELASFGEADPELAAECGVEIGALEARSLLGSGACVRIATAAADSVQTGRPASLAAGDLEALSRLEAVVALSSSRIGLKLAAADAAAAQEPLARLTNLLGLAGGAYGLIKSIF